MLTDRRQPWDWWQIWLLHTGNIICLADATLLIEPPHDKTNKMARACSEDSDQPRHPPSLIRVFAVHMKKTWVLIYPLSTHWRLWSDWVAAQADLNLLWAHSHFVGFIVRRLIKLNGQDIWKHKGIYYWRKLLLLCFCVTRKVQDIAIYFRLPS